MADKGCFFVIYAVVVILFQISNSFNYEDRAENAFPKSIMFLDDFWSTFPDFFGSSNLFNKKTQSDFYVRLGLLYNNVFSTHYFIHITLLTDGIVYPASYPPMASIAIVMLVIVVIFSIF